MGSGRHNFSRRPALPDRLVSNPEVRLDVTGKVVPGKAP